MEKERPRVFRKITRTAEGGAMLHIGKLLPVDWLLVEIINVEEVEEGLIRLEIVKVR